MRVTLINSIAGLAVLVVAALVLPSRWGAPVLPWGVLAGVIPVTIGFVRGERLSDLGYLGLAIVLICLVPGERAVRPSPRHSLSPLSSAASSCRSPSSASAWPGGARQAAADDHPRDGGLRRAVWADRCRCRVSVPSRVESGELSIVSVLNALAPAGTVVLAAVLLRERIAPVQGVGLAVALVSAALLALA